MKNDRNAFIYCITRHPDLKTQVCIEKQYTSRENFLQYVEYEVPSVEKLYHTIKFGKTLKFVSDKITPKFIWQCLHKLVMRFQNMVVEQNYENGIKLALDAGLTCDWRTGYNGPYPHIYWVPKEGLTIESFL